MKISSPVFENNSKIPLKYTCDGDNVSPPLVFSDIPSEAKSVVLIIDDPDIPEFVKEKFNIEKFDHWVLFNIKPDTKIIAEGTVPGTQGVNSRGSAEYTGPCPPDREHRYFFKLYALDFELTLDSSAKKKDVEKAMEGHILAKAELVGLYKRQ